MASISPIISVFSLLLFTYPVLSDHSPAHSPSPHPHPPADQISTPPATAPSPARSLSSPPAPPPPDLDSHSTSPAPAADTGDIKRESEPNAADLDNKGGGISSGQKVGVAVGVIAGVLIVGAGVVVYKKRQQNIQRSQYGYAARREIL